MFKCIHKDCWVIRKITLWSFKTFAAVFEYCLCVFRWQVGYYERYYNDYVKLYVKTIREVVLREDTSRPFVSSSPSNGVESEQEGWVAQNPQDEHYGDGELLNGNSYSVL